MIETVASFDCLSCDYKHASVRSDGSYDWLELYLADGTKVIVFSGRVVCPVCGTTREFVRSKRYGCGLGSFPGNPVP